MEQLTRDWWRVASTKELKSKPVAKQLLGFKIVLFRDRSGRPVALEDRCPHRNVSLSLGRTESGRLRCAYHGWLFDGSGDCVEIPCQGPSDKKQIIRGPAKYPCFERDGTIWIRPIVSNDSERPEEGSSSHFSGWPTPPDKVPPSFEIISKIRAPMELILHNFVDCGHTGFVHRGLFRGPPEQEITARLEETQTGLRIETVGERSSQSVLSKMFARTSGEVLHIDELIVPHTVLVKYHFGTSWIQTVSVCSPIEENLTEVATRVWIHCPPFSRLFGFFLKVITKRILRQDVEILENQAKQLDFYRQPQFASTASDLPTLWISRVLKEYRQGKFPGEALKKTEVRYRI